jgi:hypothetical protein
MTSIGLGGGLIQAGGLYAEYEANKQASKHNEALAMRNASYAIKQGAEMERRQRVLGRQVIGSIKAGYAASGVTLEGSAIDVLEASAATAELDSLTIRYDSQMRAEGFRAEARMEHNRRRAARDSRDFDMASSFVGAGV